jgi:hypothetical protein
MTAGGLVRFRKLVWWRRRLSSSSSPQERALIYEIRFFYVMGTAVKKPS